MAKKPLGAFRIPKDFNSWPRDKQEKLAEEVWLSMASQMKASKEAAGQPRDEHGRYGSTGGHDSGAPTHYGEGLITSTPASRAGVKAVIEACKTHNAEEVREMLESGKLTNSLEATKNDPVREEQRQAEIRDALAGHAPQANPEALFTAGGAASGKSSLVGSGPADAVLSDPDKIKTGDSGLGLDGIPEYRELVDAGGVAREVAASYVHEESSQMSKELTAAAINARQNVIVDGVGNSGAGSFAGKVQAALDAGYKTEVKYMTVPVETALERNNARYEHELAKQGYGRKVGDATLTEGHEKVSQRYPEVAALTGATVKVYDNSGPRGSEPTLISEKPAGSDKINVLDEGKYQAFLDKAKGK
jgi:Zeta toxin